MYSCMCSVVFMLFMAMNISYCFPGLSNKTIDDFKTFREKLTQFGIEIKNKFRGFDNDLQSLESDIAKEQLEKYNEHCYYFGKDTLSWPNAQRKCQLVGGNLVKIDDSSENTWLKSKTDAVSGSMYWIGLSDLVEGEFRWNIDQEVVSYKNFQNGQPNNSGGNQNCIFFNSVSATWEDQDCGNRYKYICENAICY